MATIKAPKTLEAAKELIWSKVEKTGDYRNDICLAAQFCVDIDIREVGRTNEDDEGWLRLMRIAGNYNVNTPGAWCIMFLSFCSYVAGKPLGERWQGFYSTGMLKTWMEKKDIFIDRDDSEYLPQKGDLAVMDLNVNDVVDHGGLIVEVETDFDSEGVEYVTRVQCIEGNYSNATKKVWRKWKDKTIVGFGTPDEIEA